MDFGELFSGILLIAFIIVALKAAEYRIIEAVFIGFGIVFMTSQIIACIVLGLIFGRATVSNNFHLIAILFSFPCAIAWILYCLYEGHKAHEVHKKEQQKLDKEFRDWKAQWREIRRKQDIITTETTTSAFPKHSHVLKYRNEWHSALSKTELGKRYERYCGYLLEKDGWEVEYSGIVRGLKDGGIDLRAFCEGRMIAAQCKFWERKRKIRSNTISQFIGDLDREMGEHPNLQVIGLFCCKNDNFDTGCKERLESKGIWIHIKDYDNKYPCVKCIAASGLYYVPQHRDYDAIAFSIHRGDRHCYDEAEAEKLGFRGAV